tara:strand:- start:456 stop:692 length:237 start_codon:yes stop_codon:yes gene_type:complete
MTINNAFKKNKTDHEFVNLFPKKKRVKPKLTREEVKMATSQFLAHGGQIIKIEKNWSVPGKLVDEKEHNTLLNEWNLN